MKVDLATKVRELSEERQRVKDLRAECADKTLEASKERAQTEGLQGALDRLSKLVEEGVQHSVKPQRQRAAKAFGPKKRI